MTNQSMLICLGSAIATFAISGMAAAQEPTRPANTQLPKQVLSTGAEDATAPTAAARTAAPSSADTATLERQLVAMTSESDQGLKAVKQADGSTRVDLDGRFMSVLVSTPTSDGGNEVTCHTGKDAVAKAKQAALISAGKAPKPMKTVAAAPKPAPAVLEEK